MHNLFLVVKESLNTIAKHSGASEVRVGVEVSAGNLSLSIEDNGKGFSSPGSAFGNGLLNMEKRMRTIGGKFVLNSEPGVGTKIKLWVPFRESDLT